MAWKRPALFHVARVCGAALVITAAVALVGILLVKVATLTLAIIFAVALACLLSPVARRLERWRLPRSLASFLAVLLAVGVLAGAVSWIVPTAASQISENREQLITNVKDLGAKVNERLPEVFSGAGGQSVTAYVEKHSQRIASGVAAGVITTAEIAGGLLLALVLTFFLLRDGSEIASGGLGRLSEQKRRVFEPALRRSWETLRAWISGAAIIALVDAVGIGLGLVILGVPLALPLALLTFFGAFIPILGATVAGILAILVALASGGTTDALITLAIVVGVQQLEGNVLEPVVMGRKVPLHPASVLITVTAGALLGGVAGAFVAVPAAATATAFFREVWRHSDPADRPQARDEGARSESMLAAAAPGPPEPPPDSLRQH